MTEKLTGARDCSRAPVDVLFSSTGVTFPDCSGRRRRRSSRSLALDVRREAVFLFRVSTAVSRPPRFIAEVS